MQVTHPQADRDAPVPAAVTCPDGETRHPDSDGVVEAPEDVAVALADAWADCYGVPPDGLLTHGDDEPDTCDTVKNDGEVCGREPPCPYHSDGEA
jgi:hypothetical protein